MNKIEKQNKKIITQTLARHGIEERFDLEIEEKIVSLRLVGNNRYEIREILRKEYIVTPCSTTIYNICKRHGLNKLTKGEKQEKRKIIMRKIGELVHIDCHQLSKGITIADPKQTYYLLGFPLFLFKQIFYAADRTEYACCFVGEIDGFVVFAGYHFFQRVHVTHGD